MYRCLYFFFLHNDIHEVNVCMSQNYVHVQVHNITINNNYYNNGSNIIIIDIFGTTKWSVLVDGMFAQWFSCIHARFWHS